MILSPPRRQFAAYSKMMMIMKTLLLVKMTLATSLFTSPSRFSRELWRVGDIETVRFSRPNFSDYTIALWQQNMPKGAASLGPVIFRKLHMQYHSAGGIA